MPTRLNSRSLINVLPNLQPPSEVFRLGDIFNEATRGHYQSGATFAPGEGVRDTKVDAEAIHQQNGLNPSVRVRKAAGAFVGQLGKLRPIVNRPDAALAPHGGGSQPPRRLPACPTSRQRFHFYGAHPGGRVQPPCSEFHTIIAVSAIITTLVVPAITLAHIPFFQ